MRRIRYIVIHCSAGQPTSTMAGVRAHWAKLGWDRPGYHKMILANGAVEELSDDERFTYGVKGFNANSIHICYMGGVDKDGKTPKDTRTDAQKETMEQLVKEYMLKYPKAQILGHKDFKGVRKACPSFDVKGWLKEIHLA